MRRNRTYTGTSARIATEEDSLIGGASTPSDTSVVVVGEPLVNEGGAENLETEIIAVNDAAADLEVDQAQIEIAVDDIEALTNIAGALDAAAAQGGIDQHSAAVVQVAIESITSRLGGREFGMPSLENFGVATGRAASTRIAMEDILDKVKETWKKIIEALKKAAAWVVEFFKSIFDANTKLLARAQNLVKKADATKGTAKEAKIEDARLFAALQINGAVTAAGATGLVTSAKHVLGEVADNNLSLVKGVTDVLKKSEVDLKTFVADFSAPPGKTSGLTEVTNAEGAGFAAAKAGLSTFRSEEMPGGKAVISRLPKTELKGKDGLESFVGIATGMGDFDPKRTKSDKKEVATLSTADASKVATQVAELAAVLKAFAPKQDEMAKAKKDLISTAESVANKANKENAEGATAASRVAQALARVSDQPQVAFAHYALVTGKAMLDLVEKSLKQYAEVAAPKAAAAA